MFNLDGKFQKTHFRTQIRNDTFYNFRDMFLLNKEEV